MLIDKFDSKTIYNYFNYLKCVGMLSGLSSESDAPYINSRVAENAFCLSTKADNLGRADCSVDAKLGDIGIGIKTFLAGNNNTMQKIAEFNKDAHMIKHKSEISIVQIISNLRNERLFSTTRIYGIKKMIYHCIIRETNTIKICEYPMDTINIDNISEVLVKNNGTAIYFKDGKNEYSFNLNKNTLYKRFDTNDSLFKIDIEIIKEPYSLLSKMIGSDIEMKVISDYNHFSNIILPLFSDKGGRNVPEKSGLNQWNAAGRKRNLNEIYIPIPSWINKAFPNFFPKRDISFELKLPNENSISAKVCQQGDKALMSNPNLDLGKWLLRDVMCLSEGELLTYEKLQILGIDSVEVCKLNDFKYKIDFRPIGTYDEFLEEHKM